MHCALAAAQFHSHPALRPSHHPRPSRSSPGSQKLPSIARPAPALPPWGPLRFCLASCRSIAVSYQTGTQVAYIRDNFLHLSLHSSPYLETEKIHNGGTPQVMLLFTY
ncbi:hypothetical protein CapIbe_021799 [Capra ibex]